MAKSDQPQVVQLSAAQLEELLGKLKGLLPAETYPLVEKLLRTLHWITGVLEHKNPSLARLKRLLFGARTEKTSHLFFPRPASPRAQRRQRRQRHHQQSPPPSPRATAAGPRPITREPLR